METNETTVVQEQPTEEIATEGSSEQMPETPGSNTDEEDGGEVAVSSSDEDQPEENALEDEVPKTISVTIDGEEKEYTPEELAPLIEGGHQWIETKPIIEKLKYLTTFTGQGIPQVIDTIVAAVEQGEYTKTLEACGGNEEIAKRLHEYQLKERKLQYETLKSEESNKKVFAVKTKQEQLNERLAADYIELAKECPDEFQSFKDVPKPVINMAVKKGISLYDAYLRYQRTESQKAKNAAIQQETASKASVGPLSTPPISEPDTATEEFRVALRAALD